RAVRFPAWRRQPDSVMTFVDFTGANGELCARLGTAAGGKSTLVELKVAGGECACRRTAGGKAKGDRPTRRTAARLQPYRSRAGAPQVAKLQGKCLALRQGSRL